MDKNFVEDAKNFVVLQVLRLYIQTNIIKHTKMYLMMSQKVTRVYLMISVSCLILDKGLEKTLFYR